MESDKNKNFISSRLQSFGYAFKGLESMLRSEKNARIHLIAAIAVVILGFIYKLRPGEWIAITIVIGLVFAAELFNTAIEGIVDKISPEHDPDMGKVKDLAAAAVLVTAISALITGLIIFIPKIF
jgi:diacylglycerol kinase